MELNKNCPFSGKRCNTSCACLITHGQENYYAQKYDYTYSCGLIPKGNITRFTNLMQAVK